MSFEDLPDSAKQMPLTDSRLRADVIDLIILEEDRAAGCVGLMLCDSDDRGVQPVVLKGVPDDADRVEFARLLDLVLPLVAATDGSVIIGRGRPRGTRPNDSDRGWHEQAIRSCREHGVRLLGFHLATGDGVFPLPEPLEQAS